MGLSDGMHETDPAARIAAPPPAWNRADPHVLRVLMTASSYPRHEHDSAAIFLRELARHLARRGAAVLVLAPHDAAARGDQPADPGVQVMRFRYAVGPGARLAYGAGILPNLAAHPWLLAQVPGFLIGQALALRRALRAFKPALLHAHWVLPQGALGAALAGRVPMVISAHGGDAWALQGHALGAVKRWTLRRAAAWTANTAATAQACAQAGVPQPRVIPMGVDADAFAQGDGAALKARVGESRAVVLFVGRLVEKKGAAVLIDAWQRIGPARRAGRVLWLVGDGTQRAGLERQMRAAGLEPEVRFFGRVPNQALADFYAAAAVCVAPSIVDRQGDTEGQGVVLIEAMAAGRAVLASNVGGIAEVVTDGVTGVLVPPTDAGALAAALASLLDDPRRADALGAAAQAQVKARFDWPVIAGKFIEVYDDALASSRRARP